MSDGVFYVSRREAYVALANQIWGPPRNWRPSFAVNLFNSIDWDYVFSFGPMHRGRR